MKTKELIEKLKLLDPDSDVYTVFDGAMRAEVEVVYETRRGDICLSFIGEYVTESCDMPESVPKDCKWWYVK